jgi:parvulin-like peptidyl-prolyl isomerase
MKLAARILLIAGLLYLAGDLFLHGPARRWLDSTLTPRHLVARVSGQPITRSQLERALIERLWLEGKSAAPLAPDELKLARAAALEELIDHELLSLQIKASTTPLLVSDYEINERIHRLVGRFENKDALETAMKSQGIANEKALRDRLAARIRQEKLIAQRIAPAIHVTDDEARQWFTENQSSISLPERIEARHIFLPTLDHPSEVAKQKLEIALTTLTTKQKDFPTLAREISEDPATKDTGGALDWMTRNRLPADFADPLFSLPLNQPKLIRTKLGWHLVEVTARQHAEQRTFESAKPEIHAALEALKRRQALADFRKTLRQTHAAEIEIFDRGRW